MIPRNNYSHCSNYHREEIPPEFQANPIVGELTARVIAVLSSFVLTAAVLSALHIKYHEFAGGPAAVASAQMTDLIQISCEERENLYGSEGMERFHEDKRGVTI